MGVAYTNGFQKRSGPFAVLGNAKHYLGDGGTANGVNNGNTAGDEAALRALHLTPYEAVVRAGIGSIMASYSSCRGRACTRNAAMVNGVLRATSAFAGFVGSDYNGCYQNGVNPAGCLNGGVDMFMTFGKTAAAFLSEIRPLVPAPCRSRASTMRSGGSWWSSARWGLLDGSGKLVDRALTAQIGSAAHRAVARRAVAASIVVLKNEGGTLPLAKDVPGIALGGKTGDNVGNQCGGLDGDLAGHDRRRHHRHHGAPGAGSRRARPRLLRAGRVGDRQRRQPLASPSSARRRTRRLRRHPSGRGNSCVEPPTTLSSTRRRAGGDTDEAGGPEDRGGVWRAAR